MPAPEMSCPCVLRSTAARSTASAAVSEASFSARSVVSCCRATASRPLGASVGPIELTNWTAAATESLNCWRPSSPVASIVIGVDSSVASWAMPRLELSWVSRAEGSLLGAADTPPVELVGKNSLVLPLVSTTRAQ